MTEAALRKIAADYTREPGVRQFERLLAKALRKATTKLADDPTTRASRGFGSSNGCWPRRCGRLQPIWRPKVAPPIRSRW